MEEGLIRVLLIEDNPFDARLVREFLTQPEGSPFALEHADRLQQGLKLLPEGRFDAVLLDLGLPDALGMDTLFKFREQAGDLPVVVLSGNDDVGLGESAVREGAQDYLVKGKFDARAIERTLRHAIQRTLYSRRFKTLALQDLAQVEPEREEHAHHCSVLYRLGRRLNSVSGLSELFDLALDMVFQEVPADRGVVFLLDEAGEQQMNAVRVRGAAPDPDLEACRAVTLRAIEAKAGILSQAHPTGNGSAGIPAALAAPLWDTEGVVGALYLDHQSDPQAFTKEDLDLLGSLCNLLAVAVRRSLAEARARRFELQRVSLERFHNPEVVSLILNQPDAAEDMTKYMVEREATILFSDICNSTRLLERLDPPEAAALFNDYFEAMTEIIFRYRGTVDKFIGDCIMAVFGAPISHGNDAELALFAALEMVRRNREFQAARAKHLRFGVRIGVNTGWVMAGYLGSRRRLDYTVLGDAVNVAARLPYLAPPNRVVVGEITYSQTSEQFRFRDKGVVRLQGKKKETRYYELLGKD